MKDHIPDNFLTAMKLIGCCLRSLLMIDDFYFNWKYCFYLIGTCQLTYHFLCYHYRHLVKEKIIF